MLKLGIVGLPNVGKSTLFNALTAAKAEAANYPFCTVEPNVGMVEVPDARLNRLAQIVQPKRTVAAVVQFVDIAGLVKGAAEGQGLGNKFLANIRETDAIVHVVRCFEDPDVSHVMGRVDPVRDREVVEFELALADLSTVEKRLDRSQRAARSGRAKSRAGGDRSVLGEDRGRAVGALGRGAHRVPASSRHRVSGTRSPNSRGLSPAWTADVLHRRRCGSARLDDSSGRDRAAGRGGDPHRFRARIHSRRDGELRRIFGERRMEGSEGTGTRAG